MWCCGAQVAIAFGSEARGASGAILKWMRRAAARLALGGGAGAATATILALHGGRDPARVAVLAPVNRYHEEMWQLTDPVLRDHRTLAAGVLPWQ